MPTPSAPPAYAPSMPAHERKVNPQYLPANANDRMMRLQQILSKYEITIADVNDLVALEDYEIVFVADDSGSMQLSSVPIGQRTLGGSNASRWDELRSTVATVAEIACCLDQDGIDLYFLNRPPLLNVTSTDDPRFTESFNRPPNGSTPLTETVSRVMADKAGSEKPVLMLIATDGEPNRGPEPFKRVITNAVNQRNGTKFRFQILACTEDDDQVEWLNEFDDCTKGIDVTDDYHSEKKEIMAAGRVRHFRRSDWVVKALLGPIMTKYDELDKPIVEYRKGKKSIDDGCCIVM